MEPADAVAPFAAALRFGRGQIVSAAARMRVEHEKRRRLLMQMFKQHEQNDVLMHISKVSGMKGVAIVQVRV